MYTLKHAVSLVDGKTQSKGYPNYLAEAALCDRISLIRTFHSKTVTGNGTILLKYGAGMGVVLLSSRNWRKISLKVQGLI